jgi:hypothetical protein
VFRAGMICSNSGQCLSYEQAAEVGRFISGAEEFTRDFGTDGFELYRESFKHFSNQSLEKSLINRDLGKNVPRVWYQLTPIINFPAFFIRFQGHDLVVRESATICVGSADSKLWISVSKKVDESNSNSDLSELYQTFDNYINVRLPEFLKYYNSVFQFLIRQEKFEFSNLSVDDIDIRCRRKIIVNSLEVRSNVNEFLQSMYDMDASRIRLLLKESRHWELLRPFMEYAAEAVGIDDYSLFNLFIQNSTPTDIERGVERSSSDKSYVEYLSMDRLALCLAGTLSGLEVPVEYYFTLGQSDTRSKVILPSQTVPHIGRRFRNADFTSRSIMKQVGRVY